MIPKGFFPEQDTGFDLRQRRGRAGHFLGGDVGPSRRDGQDHRHRSGRRRRRLHCRLLDLQHRQLLHQPETARRSAGRAPTRSSPGCDPSWPPSRAPISISRSRRTSRSAADSAGPNTNTRLQDADLDELDVWAPKLVAKLQELPQLADVTSDQQANAAYGDADHRSRPGGTLRHPAGADRRDDLRRHRPASR